MSQVAVRRIFFSVLALLMSAPLLVVLGVSVNERKSLTFPPQGFNLSWYLDLFRLPDWSGALLNSVIIAFLSAALAVAIAFPLAWFNWRYRIGWVKGILAIGLMPFLLRGVNLQDNRRTALPVATVTRRVLQALESHRPRARYLVPDRYFLYWLLPRLWKTELHSVRLATTHFWFGLIGIGI